MPVGVLISLARMSSITFLLVFFGVSSFKISSTTCQWIANKFMQNLTTLLERGERIVALTFTCRLLLVLPVTGVFPLLLTGFSTTGTCSGSGGAVSSAGKNNHKKAKKQM